MKVVVKNSDKEDPKSSNRLLIPIPYERPEIPEFKKGDGQTYRLRNDPANDKSPGYEISVRYFSSGSCEEFLLFETAMRQVFKGQGVNNDGPGRFDIAHRLLIGGALTTFNQARPSEIPAWVALAPKMPGAVGSNLRGFAVLGSDWIQGHDALASEESFTASCLRGDLA